LPHETRKITEITKNKQRDVQLIYGRDVTCNCSIDKLLAGFNYTSTVHYTIKKSRFAYYLVFFCQLQCFAVNSTVSFYMTKYIAMYNFRLEFKHIDEKQIFTLTLAYILVAFSEVRGNSNAGSLVESFLSKVGAPSCPRRSYRYTAARTTWLCGARDGPSARNGPSARMRRAPVQCHNKI